MKLLNVRVPRPIPPQQPTYLDPFTVAYIEAIDEASCRIVLLGGQVIDAAYDADTARVQVEGAAAAQDTEGG